MSEDLMRRLRATDPAARLHLAADDAMRETIMTTDVTTETTDDTQARVVRARRRRGVAVTGGLAAVLVGGGVAYAAVDGQHRGTGPADGITCLTRWDAPEEERSGGPLLTGDPVADCQEYQAMNGLPPITDPVAVRHEGLLVVAPRDEVPTEATPQAPDPQARAVRALEASLGDEVDGLGAQCLDAEAAVAAARAELDRLGLDDWTVRVQERTPGTPELECADIGFAYDDVPEQEGVADPTPAADPAVPRTLAVVPGGRASRESEEVHPFVASLTEALRTGITEACVDLDTAERITAEAIGDEHHWPTVVVEDPAAECTQADLEVGGSVQVTLRGPRP